jgi:hypothetical protein
LEQSAIRALSRIRSLKNTRSPINRLHPDALFLVFEALSIVEKKKWMRVGRVCRYWRNNILSFPSLWSVADSLFIRTAYLCLERSKSAPLSVYIGQHCPQELVEALSSHTNHIRELHITLSDSNFFGMAADEWIPVSHLLGGTAPMLRDFSIEFERGSDHEKVWPHYPPLQLKLDAPGLQSFNLGGISLGQLTSPIVNLAKLILHNCPDDSSMTQFLDLLESNVNLRRIILVCAGPQSDDGDPRRIVHLNRLKSLTISYIETKVILSHLSLPATADINIPDGCKPPGPRGIIERMLPASLTYLPSTQGLEMTSISISSALCFAIRAHRPGNTGSLVLGGLLFRHYYPNCFYSLYPLPVVHVRELWLKGLNLEPIDDGVTDEYLQSMFFSLPSLDTLFLINCNFGSIFQMLQPRDGHMPCPSLTTLTIYATYSIDCLGILHLTAMRESRGAPFERISLLCSTNGTLEGVECLPKYVDVVEGNYRPPEFPYLLD